MFGLEVIDLIVIGAYFVVVLWIGFRAMRHIRNQEDYFLGGRRFGKLVQIRIPAGANTNRYIEAITARDTGFVHIYKRGETGPNGVIRLEYDGWTEEATSPVEG